jgi:hypothetical protein
MVDIIWLFGERQANRPLVHGELTILDLKRDSLALRPLPNGSKCQTRLSIEKLITSCAFTGRPRELIRVLRCFRRQVPSECFEH